MTDNAIGQAILKAIEGLKEDFKQDLKSAVKILDGRIAAIETKINAWPDLHFLQAAVQQQLREAREARASRRNVEIKLDEIYTSMATSSEIAKLRDEVAASIDREKDLDLRVATLEGHAGLKNPVAPE